VCVRACLCTCMHVCLSVCFGGDMWNFLILEHLRENILIVYFFILVC
jgi:hypothetical protein